MKQVMMVNTSLSMGTGKLAAQVSHASVGSYDNARDRNPRDVQKWKRQGQKKVVVKGEDTDHLHELRMDARTANIPCFLVEDAGLTQLKPGSVTVLGLGPAPDDKIDRITGNLNLL